MQVTFLVFQPGFFCSHKQCKLWLADFRDFLCHQLTFFGGKNWETSDSGALWHFKTWEVKNAPPLFIFLRVQSISLPQICTWTFWNNWLKMICKFSKFFPSADKLAGNSNDALFRGYSKWFLTADLGVSNVFQFCIHASCQKSACRERDFCHKQDFLLQYSLPSKDPLKTSLTKSPQTPWGFLPTYNYEAKASWGYRRYRACNMSMLACEMPAAYNLSPGIFFLNLL